MHWRNLLIKSITSSASLCYRALVQPGLSELQMCVAARVRILKYRLRGIWFYGWRVYKKKKREKKTVQNWKQLNLLSDKREYDIFNIKFWIIIVVGKIELIM